VILAVLIAVWREWLEEKRAEGFGVQDASTRPVAGQGGP